MSFSPPAKPLAFVGAEVAGFDALSEDEPTIDVPESAVDGLRTAALGRGIGAEIFPLMLEPLLDAFCSFFLN